VLEISIGRASLIASLIAGFGGGLYRETGSVKKHEYLKRQMLGTASVWSGKCLKPQVLEGQGARKCMVRADKNGARSLGTGRRERR
jgi:hypothetical protein